MSNLLIQGEKKTYLDSLNKKRDLPNSPETGEIGCHFLVTYLEARGTGTIADLPGCLVTMTVDPSL